MVHGWGGGGGRGRIKCLSIPRSSGTSINTSLRCTIISHDDPQHLEGRWLADIERWVAKFVARQLATAALWVRIQTSLIIKNTKLAT
jgi:hypothetical protein